MARKPPFIHPLVTEFCLRSYWDTLASLWRIFGENVDSILDQRPHSIGVINEQQTVERQSVFGEMGYIIAGDQHSAGRW